MVAEPQAAIFPSKAATRRKRVLRAARSIFAWRPPLRVRRLGPFGALK